MGFTLREYSEQKLEFDKQVIALRGKHSVPSEDKLSEPRKHQVKFLRKCLSLLDAPVNDSLLEEAEKIRVQREREKEKARTFSGLMLIVRDEIDKKSHYLKSWDNGLFKAGLGEAVGISEENVLDPNSAANMISSAMKFIVSNCFEKGDTTKALLEDHPFAQIDSFDLKDFWNRGTNMQNAYRQDVMAESAAKREKTIAEKQEVSSGGFFSGWLGGGKKEEKQVDVDFKVAENSMK